MTKIRNIDEIGKRTYDIRKSLCDIKQLPEDTNE
jgi:hypothetical protein